MYGLYGGTTSQNTKSAEYVASLARKQDIGLGNCQKLKVVKTVQEKVIKIVFRPLSSTFFVTNALKIHNFF